MKTDCAAMNSSVGKKVLMALSGIALMLFLIVHLGGNLTLFACDGGALFNTYAHHLESLGPLLYVAEAGLLAIFLLHVSRRSAWWRTSGAPARWATRSRPARVATAS
jgi:succinate dehydrogenase / fumarate reductase cytochrome b subunit